MTYHAHFLLPAVSVGSLASCQVHAIGPGAARTPPLSSTQAGGQTFCWGLWGLTTRPCPAAGLHLTFLSFTGFRCDSHSVQFPTHVCCVLCHHHPQENLVVLESLPSPWPQVPPLFTSPHFLKPPHNSSPLHSPHSSLPPHTPLTSTHLTPHRSSTLLNLLACLCLAVSFSRTWTSFSLCSQFWNPD